MGGLLREGLGRRATLSAPVGAWGEQHCLHEAPPPVGPAAVCWGLAEQGRERHLVGLYTSVPAGVRSPGVRLFVHLFIHSFIQRYFMFLF